MESVEDYDVYPTARKMDPEIKALWLEALRSGEYKQGEGNLCRLVDGVERHCCLGVLSELYPNVQKRSIGNGIFALLPEGDGSESATHLPHMVIATWAGIDESYSVQEDDGRWTTLYSMNDRGYSFETIANVIEEQL